MRFDQHFLRGALPEITLVQEVFPASATFCVDSRLLQPGDIFIALSGAQHDGHAFIQEVLVKGASGVIIATQKKNLLNDISEKLTKDKLIALVPDTLQALTRMAAAWRSQFTYPVVAITGSVGKTSTKEVLSQVFSLNGTKHIASRGNQNTAIGISLNILRMRAEHQAAIFEVGINKRGEMASLVNILRPTTALITCVAHSHMEGLGALADIALEKRDIFKYFTEESIGIINGDLPILANVGYKHPVVKFGSKTTNQIQARKIQLGSNSVSFMLKIYKNKYPIIIENGHLGSVFNALAAASAAHFLGVPETVIVEGIQRPLAVMGRFESRALTSGQGGVIINDCYNANPESMKTALIALQKIETKACKIAVLGDMLELGVNSPFWHRQLGRFLRKVPTLNHVILVGDQVKWTHKTVPVGMSAEIVANWQEATLRLAQRLDQEVLVLVKGSQGMGLLNLVQKFAPKEKV